MVDARLLHRLLLIGIIAGIAFSAYAALEVLDPALRTSCTISSYFSCGAVDQSSHTTLLGVPDYEIGLGGFFAMLAIDLPLIATYDRRLLYVLTVLSAAGLAVAVVLGATEVFIIGAFCPICLGAYLSDLAVFSVAISLVRLRRTRASAATVSLEPGTA